MRKKYKKIAFKVINVFITSFVLLSIILFKPSLNAIANDLDAGSDKLIINLKEKLAEGYTNKFCNAIGIGLSKSTAAEMTIKENQNPKFNSSLWLEILKNGNKNIKQVDHKELINDVSKNIIYKCGSIIGLSTREDQSDFAQYLEIVENKIDNLSPE